MERIKKAIELARLERGATRASIATAAAPVEEIIAESGVNYTQTRQIPVDPNVLRANRVTTSLQSDKAAIAYKMLRTQVLKRMREHKWNTLAITGVSPGEGKTLTAINLAINLASEVNYTVLLVDLDLKRPSIHTYFGITPERGLSDFLLDGAPLEQILINPSIDGLVILPNSKPIQNSSEMLASSRMGKLVEELKTRYPSRFVLFDLPALLTTDDALAFSSYVDALLLVVEEGKTRKEDLVETMEILRDVNVLGTVLNKAETANKVYY